MLAPYFGILAGVGEGGSSPVANNVLLAVLIPDLPLVGAGEGVKSDVPWTESDGDDAVRRGVSELPIRCMGRTGDVRNAWKSEAYGDFDTGEDWAKMGNRPGVSFGNRGVRKTIPS